MQSLAYRNRIGVKQINKMKREKMNMNLNNLHQTNSGQQKIKIDI